MLDKIKNITRGQLIVVIFIIICAISVYVGINIEKSNMLKNYRSFENELVKAGKFYYELENLDISKSEERRVTIKSLEKRNLVSNSLKDKCKGYITITNEKNIYTEKYELIYRSYIKCGSYKTSGYTEY